MQLSKYQEQSQLLDPHLPSLVSTLTEPLQQQAHSQERSSAAPDLTIVRNICRLLWVIATVRC